MDKSRKTAFFAEEQKTAHFVGRKGRGQALLQFSFVKISFFRISIRESLPKNKRLDYHVAQIMSGFIGLKDLKRLYLHEKPRQIVQNRKNQRKRDGSFIENEEMHKNYSKRLDKRTENDYNRNIKNERRDR